MQQYIQISLPVCITLNKQVFLLRNLALIVPWSLRGTIHIILGYQCKLTQSGDVRSPSRQLFLPSGSSRSSGFCPLAVQYEWHGPLGCPVILITWGQNSAYINLFYSLIKWEFCHSCVKKGKKHSMKAVCADLLVIPHVLTVAAMRNIWWWFHFEIVHFIFMGN